MSDTTNIEWADSTFNPWMGCTKVSPACDHCYAERDTKRFGRVEWGAGKPRLRTSAANWKLPERWNRQADTFVGCTACNFRGSVDEWATHRDQHFGTGQIHHMPPARRRVFCASLADVFDNEVPKQWRFDLLNLIASTPNIDWLLLTKRIGNAQAMLDEFIASDGHTGERWEGWPNVWIGATVVNQAEADRDVPKLLAVPARVRFLSIEPMLGLIDLSHRAAKALPIYWEGTQADGPLPHYCGHSGTYLGESARRGWAKYSGRGIDWIIAGGESGPHARPVHPDWLRSLRDQCEAAGVPFLFKQWGEYAPNWFYMEDGKTEQPGTMWMDRMGKKIAGRKLDGIEHNGFPVGQG